MTQLMARTTTTLDSRLKVPMDAPTLLATWAFGMAVPNLKVLLNVSAIVVGVVIASFGELKFHLLGFILQAGGIVAEALRLVMVQRLLSSAEFKMDPLVSVYYYAPACAAVNGVVTLIIEGPRMTMNDIYSLGIVTLIANALVAFLLNVSVVLLIGKTSAVVLTMAGVLKDILLVIASMVIFGDPVTGQQYFGYSIALAGLVYYRLGREGIQTAATSVQLSLSEFRHSQSGRLKITIIGLAFTAALVFLLRRNWQSTPITGINTSTV
ncbi:hypothetical protein SLS62_005990 [Diatrype stigma]|uniref:Sugar phosphate transporter domain-containing protein n=1 Tax=Diatrype stigma TaxID=117547 RepID=A0AAN9YRM5_9PEZI